jgi:transporter family-2 protein
VPPHLFFGGVLGALFVGSSVFFIPKMGATSMIAAYITGQLIGSVLMDHFGLFGLSVFPITLTRLAGLFLLFVGLFLVIKKSA